MEYTKEELLAKAKRDYPIGTKFNSAYSGDSYLIDVFRPRWYNDHTIIIGSKGAVYNNGKWATIISTPETKIHFNYLIL